MRHFVALDSALHRHKAFVLMVASARSSAMNFNHFLSIAVRCGFEIRSKPRAQKVVKPCFFCNGFPTRYGVFWLCLICDTARFAGNPKAAFTLRDVSLKAYPRRLQAATGGSWRSRAAHALIRFGCAVFIWQYTRLYCYLSDLFD
jgi:hypothetical protein